MAGGTVVGEELWDVDGDPFIEIAHYDGWDSAYLHMADPPSDVNIGNEVSIATPVGHPSCRNVSGGSATAEHVHLGFKLDGEWVDIRGRVALCGWRVLGPGEATSGAVLERAGSYKYRGDAISCVGISEEPVYQQTVPILPQQTLDLPFAVSLGRILLRIFVGWNGSTVDAWLTAPDGTVIDASTTDPDVFHTKSDAFEYYEVRSPEDGDWTLLIHASDVPPEGEPVGIVMGSCAQPRGDAAGDACVADDDSDGCADSEELLGASAPKPGSTGAYDPLDPYDFYDVPVPALADPAPNGPRNQVVDIADVLGVLFYAFADEGGPANANGVAYDSDKMGLGTKAGQFYDRTPGTDPNPPWDAGPPNGVIDIGDVLVALAQFGLDCSGEP